MNATKANKPTAHLTILSLTLLACLVIMTGWLAQTGHTRPQSATRTDSEQLVGTTQDATSVATVPQAACGFVNAPIDPGPMDCYTALVANHDDSPIGTRTPVILIHGIHGNGPDPQTSTNDSYFANLIGHLNSNATFRERFKIYRFHYRSDYQPVYQIARSLRNRIDDLVKQNQQAFESKKFVLIAHSMGGLVARSYMNEHNTDFGTTFGGQRAGKRISKLITLATPHHGTFGANDMARTWGRFFWNLAFDKVDQSYWEDGGGCAACASDPTHPNRSDLRFDNYDGLWNSNSSYLDDQREHNDWLRNMPKTYDYLISAYFGYIGANTDVRRVGEMTPLQLRDYVNANVGQDDKLQIASGVLLARIELNNFPETPITSGSAIYLLYNDGLVPVGSGMYKQASVGKSAQCGGYNHDDMKNGTGGNCTVLGTSISKPPFDLVVDDLMSIPTGSSDTQAPAVTITSPTSNSTFSTGSGSLNLGGFATDNVGVTNVTWTNSRGGSGSASGTSTWSISGIGLQSGANILTVRAQDAAGNIGTDTLTATYTVTQNDTTAPVVKFSAPTTGSSYNTSGSTLTIRGTATDNIAVVQVTCSNNRGGNCSVSGTGNWVGSVTGLQSGANVLTVRATDAAGNAGTKTLTVNYSPPPVCDGGSSVNYRVNGSAPIHPNGTLIKTATDQTVYVLQNGQRRGIPSQTILNTLYQNGGFANKDVITVAADEMSRYSTGAVVNSSLPSNGRSQPDGRLIKQVGGAEISIVSNNGHRRPFTSESAFLGLGYLYCNVIEASDYNSYPADAAADAITILNISSITPSSIQTRDWGGSVVYTFTVTDALGSPVSGAIVGGQDNLMGIGVFIATMSTDSNGRGTWTTTVPNGASNSVFDIMFLAEKTGYTTSSMVTRQVQVNHFFDTSSPSISINSPTSAAVFNTNSGSISLAGTASDNVAVTQITWANSRGGSGTASGSSNWSVNGITLQNGTNVLEVTARDAAGNIGTSMLTVIYTPVATDTTPPSISITSPTTAVNYQTNVGQISLGGTSSDNIGVTQVVWTNDRGGSGVAAGTTAWAITGITLQTGFNVITVVAMDAAANIGTAVLIANYTTAVSPTVTTDATSDVTDNSATLRGSVNPNGLATSAWFEWGTSSNLNVFNSTPQQSVGSGVSSSSVNASLNGLEAGVTYFFRAAASNSAGTSKGSILSFGPQTETKIAFTRTVNTNQEIYVMNSDGSGQVNLTNSVASDSKPAWSPDNSKIAFVTQRDGQHEVYVMNADGSSQTNVSQNAAVDYLPAWSPDGQRILFSSDRTGLVELYLMNANGGSQTRLTFSSGGAIAGDWSGDGQRIVFMSYREGAWNIDSMNSDGGNRIALTSGNAFKANPSWSPDGSKIVYESYQDGRMEIYVMNADGSNQTRLTDLASTNQYPDWAPGGQLIAFTSDREGYEEIYVMNADGTNPNRLTFNSGFCTEPAWQSQTTQAMTNVALAANGGVASASSTTPNSQFPGYNFLPSVTIDGDRRGGLNFWRDDTANAYPDWLQVDFDGSKSITEINVVTVQDSDQNPPEPTQGTTFSLHGITAFEVQYWTGSAWVTVPNGSVTGNNKVWRQFTFSPIVTSKVRVLVNNALNTRSRIVELEAWNMPSGSNTNQALAANGGVASASSTTPNSQFAGYNFLPGVTIDGDRRGGMNFWRDDTANAYPDWLQVDFNGSKVITEIDVVTVQDNDQNTAEPTPAMTFSLYGITAYEVQYWTGSAWATVPNGSVAGNNNVWRQFTFSPINTSKVRVLVNNALNTRSRIVELEAWGTTSTTGNHALGANGGMASASSTTPNSQFPGYNFLPGVAIDGDRRGGMTFWRDDTANTYPDWLQVDFNGSKNITEIDVFTAQDNDQNPVDPTQATTFSLHGITAFEVQYWTGSAWITVPNGSVTGNNKVWRQFTFSPIATSRVRVLVNNALNTRSRIVEVEAY